MGDDLVPAGQAGDSDGVVVGLRTFLAMLATWLGVHEPALAPIASGAVVAGDPLLPIFGQVVRRRAHNVAQVLHIARRVSKRSDDEFAEAIAPSPPKQQLTAEVFEAAMRTALDEKLTALGQTWAIGVFAEDEVAVEMERKLVGALARMEAIDVALLRVIERDPITTARLSGEQGFMVTAWTVQTLETEVPDIVPHVATIVAGLEAGGLVTPTLPTRWPFAELTPMYKITELGKLAMRRLGDRAAGDPAALDA